MGSKQKLVDKIVPFVLSKHSETTDLYDLFGGGGAISLYTARNYPHLSVHYNELSKAIGGLMQHLQAGGIIPYGFVPRAQFESEHTGDDWWAGVLQTCWSFGNNQKGYLYGTNIEEYKKQLSSLILTGKGDRGYVENYVKEALSKKGISTDYVKVFLDPSLYHTPYQRRIVLARQLHKMGLVEHLPRLERLEQIAKMPEIKKLIITSGLSYADIPITGNRPLVYCDPPYENTAEYREGGFYHQSFYNWCAEQPYPVYVSSYKVSDRRLVLVKAIKTRSLLSSSTSNAPTYNYENIYWNGKN